MLSPHQARADRGAARAMFWREWIADPLRVASVTPSSAALGRAITAGIDASSAPVIELGPGTGVFTEALLARGVPEHALALIELGDAFARRLAARYPAATIVSADAGALRRLRLFEGERAGAVVSGLPMLSMPPARVLRILAGAFHHLREDGALHQFTYGPRCPIPAMVLRRLGLVAERTDGTVRNMPPASVYRVTRQIADRRRAD